MTSFHQNSLYQLLSKPDDYSIKLLDELHDLLHEQPELATLSHPVEGSYFHLICRNSHEDENVTHRMIYALSNAGANPNLTDGKGNTPLHEALRRDPNDIQMDLIQALFRVGVDPCIKNKSGKTANSYLNDDPQLIAFYEAYGDGIWEAVRTSNISETERLIKGFTKVDCKSTNKTTLLDEARRVDSSPIIHLLADYQVTIEFIHSILACDWQRASLIHQYQYEFIKINAIDSIHTFTWARTIHRTFGKSILEISLETRRSEPFDLIFSSSKLKSNVDVNISGTDGLPFFFNCFHSAISDEHRKDILFKANFNKKSSKGETFLFHLVHLYQENEQEKYLQTFVTILDEQPILLVQRNEQGRTVVDEIELTPALIYHRLRPFYQSIRTILDKHWNNQLLCERFILNSFGYHVLLFTDDQHLQTNLHLARLIQSLKLRQGLSMLMFDLVQAILDDNLNKIQQIYKMHSNIVLAKDWSGRTCAHLAVLHQRRQILQYICENHSHIINFTDNLNRTPLHYASIMNDTTAIHILEKINAKKVPDCFYLYPDDYLTRADLCSDEFHAQGFPRSELERRVSGVSDYLKLFYYQSLKQSIEENQIDQLKMINEEMNMMGFHLKDFDPNSYLNDWLKGQRYVPLVFLALEHRSVSAIQCLMELGLPLTGRMYMTKSIDPNNSRCVSFRTRAEELECFDIIGIINDLEDDSELKTIFKRHLSPIGTIPSSPTNMIDQSVKRQKLPEQSYRSQTIKSQACTLF